MSEQREDLESARKHHRPRGTVSVYQQKGSGNWWVQNYRNGKPYRESARTTDRRKAEKFLQKRQAEVAGGNFLGPRIERILVSELAEDLLRDYRINGRKSLAWAERRWKLHAKPFFGALGAAQVSSDLLNRYVDERQNAKAEDATDALHGKKQRLARPAKNSTINRELAFLKRVSTWLRRNPAAGLPRAELSDA